MNLLISHVKQNFTGTPV